MPSQRAALRVSRPSSSSQAQLSSISTAITLPTPAWRSTRMKLATPEQKPKAAISPG